MRIVPDTQQESYLFRLAGGVRLANITPRYTPWLWPDRIPLGGVTLLVGDPGLGKSLLTLDLAARLSRGASWPDGSELPNYNRPKGGQPNPAADGSPPNSSSQDGSSDSIAPSPVSVLLLTAEDCLSSTVCPRLMAAGGDCANIAAIHGIEHIQMDTISHVSEARRRFMTIGGLLDELPSCRLVVVDPVTAYSALGDVHKILRSLATIARNYRVAIVVVSHLRKKEGADLYRAAGPITIVSSARAAWLVSRDPADPERRLMLPLKNNLTKNATGLSFKVVNGQYDLPRIEWSNESIDVSSQAALGDAAPRGRPDDELRFAIAWLDARLTADGCPSRQIRRDAAENGITHRTLYRAFRNLNCEAVHVGGGAGGSWVWKRKES
jgi:putative DNA primase/helicase